MTLQIDDGFCYGLGVFETIAVENGRALFLNQHIERMIKAAERLELDWREGDFQSGTYIEQKWEKLICEYITEQNIQRGAVKLTVTAENILLTHRDNPYKEEDYQRGFVLEQSSIRRNESSPLTYFKTLNYGDNIMEKRRAHKDGFDEPFFLNMRGELTEGAVTNLFFVKKGKILTPSVACGLLDGIVRRFVIEQFPVTEQVILPQDIFDMDEMFVTNSLLGIMPVRKCQGHVFTERGITEQIRKAYLLRTHLA